MKSLTITSSRTAAGKTTVGLGIALNTDLKCGYYKPFGDHLVYSKKNLHDLDAMVYHKWLGMGDEVLESTLGFDADKILSHWNSSELDSVLKRNYQNICKDKDLVLVETARNYSYGGHMDLDSVSLAQKFDSDMILVAEGDVPLILDKVLAISKCTENIVRLKGVIINKASDEEREKIDIEVPPVLERKGIKLLGVLPKKRELEKGDMSLVLEKLNAKLIAGSDGLGNIIEVVHIGALTADQAMNLPSFFVENKLLITGGDRVDLIFAALNMNTAGIVLTNNILPHPRVIAKADDLKIPIISVHMDTYSTSKAVDKIIAEITPDDDYKKTLIKDMAKANLDLDAILE
ncbi:MAG: AAA family ATPase [Candidatus Thermoplasmatota archaeon]|nr:phosphotransacetylase family protein [Euryarchaeota archaeon]MBU4031460.1 AAA family ATPase [Candidatus Thermoplasmatota archaeon]MBU4143443.1 AAA family ATPase [Candidatus Thermoplasmatota archaeon]MBU4592633.1 AAA family ATPase [Candidatus Thermoplasmatota archaeon]